MYRVLLHPLAYRALDSLQPALRETIRRKLRQLREFPNRGKHLKHSPFRSLRIGEYRAICEVVAKDQSVIVLFIGHRKHVYSDFSKLF